MYKNKKLKASAVEETKKVTKPRINWDAMPDWINWVSQDESERWRCFINKPSISEQYGVWVVPGDNTGTCVIPPEYYPKWKGEWVDSLTERPRNKRK